LPLIGESANIISPEYGNIWPAYDYFQRTLSLRNPWRHSCFVGGDLHYVNTASSCHPASAPR
ncbi:MAG: hypothetical protein WC198_09030, partial [Victivallaceae bacterium]